MIQPTVDEDSYYQIRTDIHIPIFSFLYISEDADYISNGQTGIVSEMALCLN